MILRHLTAGLFMVGFSAISSYTVAATQPASAQSMQSEVETAVESDRKVEVRKVLFIGDSMTGWMAERLNAYGVINGFEVATIVWDGSTIKKWGASPRLAEIVREQKPDVVFISLGMNELFEAKPQSALGSSLEKIIKAMDGTPYLWIGPPSWPGHAKGQTLVDWLSKTLGSEHFFNSFTLNLPRQSKTNPHPSKAGIITWIDDLMNWIPGHTDLEFPSLKAPASNAMSRGKVFRYLRMKETL